MKKKSSSTSTTKTRRVIVKMLKQEGPMDALALASHLEISPMAVRQHLYALQEENLVTYKEEARAMGRPAKLWRLTSSADRFFPEGYAELTLGLIHSINEAFGQEGIDRILALRNRQQIENYCKQIPETSSLQKRLELLAEIRTKEGYMAEIQQQEGGDFLLIEKHCPICVVATACTGFCSKELEMFQSILGSDITIERVEHILAGELRCAYRIGRLTE
ncbi:transcriptional regulator [Aneurinibacillus migulanus]|uniref:helix-turn-helix transcriptional regulator n=1 Tax=Aneurinibacillus migulanus TaxID=47500 RepID=UPI0005BC10DB|nr:metalloregulator ArsR/SmtB family transcription factor [Aneurinibacillus migulanus]KIV56817.1 transcriptional regulator [Aneurinibacillus migulanus]KPD08591.1 transcriptional regulator [Aneurinibacillus migulanus]MCP1358235.1 transcriptional regulator [Aneurinibacillus migulanus]CEH28985.1 Transcriptional regulator, ArsR family [Aneurinibacillus migulanus]